MEPAEVRDRVRLDLGFPSGCRESRGQGRLEEAAGLQKHSDGQSASGRDRRKAEERCVPKLQSLALPGPESRTRGGSQPCEKHGLYAGLAYPPRPFPPAPSDALRAQAAEGAGTACADRRLRC